MEDLRSSITCKVCFRLLYEPFTIACGHTYCYSCLNEWFDRNEDRRKTCPDCRSIVKQAPAPAYTIKGITQIYLRHPEHLPEGETGAQHEELAAQERAIVDVDRSNTEAGGLFKGVFDKRQGPMPIVDEADGVERCPYCTWELEPGDGPLCPHCGHEHDEGSDDGYETYTVTSTSEGNNHDHPELDEEVDEDDMYDDEVFAALQHGPLGLGDGHPFGEDNEGAGNEPYYISSDDSENESVRIVGARQRAQQRQRQLHQQQQPHVRNNHRVHGEHSPGRSDTAEFSSADSDVVDHWTVQPRRRRPPIILDEEDEDGDEDEDDEETGSIRDFLDDGEEDGSGGGRSLGSNSIDSSSVDNSVDGSGVQDSLAEDEEAAPFSDMASLQSGYSENSAAIPDLTPHPRRAYQTAMQRHVTRGHRRVRRPWDDEDDLDLQDFMEEVENEAEDWGHPVDMRRRRQYGTDRISDMDSAEHDNGSDPLDDEAEDSEDEAPSRRIR